MTDTRPPVHRRRLAAVALAGAFLALTGCSNSNSGSGGGSSTATSTTPSTSASASASASASGGSATRVVIKNFAFSPASLTVKSGAEVTVVNQDSTAHTVTATGSKEFNTGTIAPGKTVTFTAPKAAGSYPYICMIHQFMKGTLTVR